MWLLRGDRGVEFRSEFAYFFHGLVGAWWVSTWPSMMTAGSGPSIAKTAWALLFKPSIIAGKLTLAQFEKHFQDEEVRIGDGRLIWWNWYCWLFCVLYVLASTVLNLFLTGHPSLLFWLFRVFAILKDRDLNYRCVARMIFGMWVRLRILYHLAHFLKFSL